MMYMAGGLNIDIHCHVCIPEYVEELRKKGNRYNGRVEEDYDGVLKWVSNWGIGNRLIPELCDGEAIVQELTGLGINQAVVSPSPTMFHYELARRDAAAHCQMLNNGLVDFCRPYEHKMMGMAVVPLQYPELAVAEITRVVEELGLRFVEICTNVNGHNLDEAELFPFFVRVAELGVVVLIHPWNVAAKERLRHYYLVNSIGNPVDTAIAAASLVFGKVLERLPNLKVVFAHGGGAIPCVLGRLERSYRVKEEARTVRVSPRCALRSVYFDTVTHSSAGLEYLVGEFGSDRLVLGSDFPFHLEDMGEPDPIGRVMGIKGIDQEGRGQILSGNVARLLGNTG